MLLGRIFRIYYVNKSTNYRRPLTVPSTLVSHLSLLIDRNLSPNFIFKKLAITASHASYPAYREKNVRVSRLSVHRQKYSPNFHELRPFR